MLSLMRNVRQRSLCSPSFSAHGWSDSWFQPLVLLPVSIVHSFQILIIQVSLDVAKVLFELIKVRLLPYALWVLVSHPPIDFTLDRHQSSPLLVLANIVDRIDRLVEWQGALVHELLRACLYVLLLLCVPDKLGLLNAGITILCIVLICLHLLELLVVWCLVLAAILQLGYVLAAHRGKAVVKFARFQLLSCYVSYLAVIGFHVFSWLTVGVVEVVWLWFFGWHPLLP